MNEEEIFHADSGDDQSFRVASLIAGYLRDELTQEEHRELDDWVTASEHNQKIFERLTDPAQLKTMLAWKERLDTNQALKRTHEKIKASQKSRYKTLATYWKFVAAAIVLLAISITLISIFVIGNRNERNATAQLANDIQPGSNHAILVLEDGSRINLDSNSSGKLNVKGHAEILNSDRGELTYRLSTTDSMTESPFSQLLIPAAGQFRLVLSDGTRIWLNAKSTLRYPAHFSGSHRKVELQGEAYFEVFRDPAHPFQVVTKKATVEVLGTHFNVSAYEDDSQTAVTLAEGQVKVNQQVVLAPGQQAQVDETGQIKTEDADLDAVLAWKNGLFHFKNAPLQEIMQQVSRWYDASIQYDAQISDHFNATIQRSVPVSKLLHILEETRAVHFTINNKKIIVSK